MTELAAAVLRSRFVLVFSRLARPPRVPACPRAAGKRSPSGLSGLRLFVPLLFALVSVAPPRADGSVAPSLPVLLPAGFLNVRGSQIVGVDGTPVRIASVGLSGMNVVGGRLGLAGPFKGMDGHVAAMKAMGFNCVRVDWIDKTLDSSNQMAQLDRFVGACANAGLKVIFDNHNNEATRADWENAAQQKNGLWFDTGPGTDGTDGAGNKGTISDARFQEDWVRFARHWASNSTVIGFDLRNEPCAHVPTPALWGGNGPTDIRAMYERVGNAILAVNPDALIICEGVINYQTGAYEGDLSVVRKLPVRLTNLAKLVYSVHEYPKEIGEYPGPDSGPGCIERMNRMWGWLVTEEVAPVWIGEMGASMSSASSKEWGATLLAYMNGEAPGGLTLKPGHPGVSGDWWAWGCLEGQNPNGCVGRDGKVRPEQAPFIDQLLFRH
jgi:endoglucanase